MISLSPLKPADIETIIDWNKDRDEDFLFRWAGQTTYKYPLTRQQIVPRLTQLDTYIFRLSEDDRFIGTAELCNIGNAENSLRLCRFLIDPELAGQGFGTSSLKRIISHAFEDLSADRLDLNVYVFNVPAVRCYEKCGFRVEKFNPSKDPKWSSYTMSLLK